MQWFSSFARRMSEFVASPAATAAAFGVILVWVVTGPIFHYADHWQLVISTVTSIVTFLMVFVLNHAQERDTRAINGKLDALIFAIQDADNRLIGMETKPISHESTGIVDEIRIAAAADH